MRLNTKIFLTWLRTRAVSDSRFIVQHFYDCFRQPESIPISFPSNGGDYLVWLGHASTLVSLNGVRILTDPVFSNRVGPRFFGCTFGPKCYIKVRLTRQALNPDIVLLSHAHFDHWDLPSLLQLNSNTIVVVPESTIDLLPDKLRSHARVIKWQETLTIVIRGEHITISGLEGNHPGARVRKDTHRKVNAYLIEHQSINYLFVGDTSHTEKLALSLDKLQLSDKNIKLALLPIGSYEPYRHNHCTPEEALEMAEVLNVRSVVPIHHSTFKLSREPLDEPVARFGKHVTKINKVVLSAGEVISIK
jgi:L-ascorbate metabolism protein UlaG (beta-lactamase superfamily)